MTATQVKGSKTATNIINHMVFLVDMSGSMAIHTDAVVKVVDGLTRHLASQSQSMGQETRGTVYLFNHDTTCVFYDMDVLRLPSIADRYVASGQTALIDATLTALDDLAMTPEKHGNHGFVLYAITDGGNNINNERANRLFQRINGLPDHWTVAALVPSVLHVADAKRYGFPAGNITTWDATTTRGVEEMGELLRETSGLYMAARATGVRSTKTLFSMGANVNAQTVAAAGLKPLGTNSYVLVPVVGGKDDKIMIKDYVDQAIGHGRYQAGKAFYPLTKRERVAGNKSILILEKATSKVYEGAGVRALLGLSDQDVRVSPDPNSEYIIYVQSTSINRHLVVGTKVLVMTS